jgi:hypothetical protein
MDSGNDFEGFDFDHNLSLDNEVGLVSSGNEELVIPER